MANTKDINTATTNDINEHTEYREFFWFKYYVTYSIPVIIQKKEIGKVFAEVKDNLVIIAGKNKKELEYLIPKTKVDHCDDKQVYLNISGDSLKEFEI